MTSFEERARAEAEQAYRGPRMFVGATVDREIAAFCEGALWAREQDPSEAEQRIAEMEATVSDLREALRETTELMGKSNDALIHRLRAEPTEAEIEAAARALDENFNPEKYPVMSAMFTDYARAALLAAKEVSE